jgi:hypothetical protein
LVAPPGAETTAKRLPISQPLNADFRRPVSTDVFLAEFAILCVFWRFSAADCQLQSLHSGGHREFRGLLESIYDIAFWP